MTLTKKDKMQIGIASGLFVIALIIIYVFYFSGGKPDPINPEDYAKKGPTTRAVPPGKRVP